MAKVIKRRVHAALVKRSKRGFRGYPVATVAFYGPDNRRASKVAVGIVLGEKQGAAELERWFSPDGDVRFDRAIGEAIVEFIQRHGAQSVAMADRIIGCPHEEGYRLSRRRSLPPVSILGKSGPMDRGDRSLTVPNKSLDWTDGNLGSSDFLR